MHGGNQSEMGATGIAVLLADCRKVRLTNPECRWDAHRPLLSLPAFVFSAPLTAGSGSIRCSRQTLHSRAGVYGRAYAS